MLTVLEILRRFIPAFLKTDPVLSIDQYRAVRALLSCRTPALGGRRFYCPDCSREHYAFYSCNHKICPRCGAADRQAWVRRELAKRMGAPYFLVTFTLPQELRECCFGQTAKLFYDLFFRAASLALAQKLESEAKFAESGFTMVLHTWNQQLQFHPHLHVLVPGAGFDRFGKAVVVKHPQFLLPVAKLQAAFREAFWRLLEAAEWKVNPEVWRKATWGVHIQPCGAGASVIKYLGRYVARTAISDSRVVSVDQETVTVRWKDRAAGGAIRLLTLSGVEFVRRFLRHTLPRGLRSIRYYGYCHPSAKRKRLRLQFATGMRVDLGATTIPSSAGTPRCPNCRSELVLVGNVRPMGTLFWRGPPRRKLEFQRSGVAAA